MPLLRAICRPALFLVHMSSCTISEYESSVSRHSAKVLFVPALISKSEAILIVAATRAVDLSSLCMAIMRRMRQGTGI